MLKQEKQDNRRFWNRAISHWQLYLMVLPALLFILIFCYKPMYGIIIAFKDYKISLGPLGSAWIGFDNFIRLFKSYWFPLLIRNTVTINLLSLIVGFPAPIILALMVNEIQHTKVKSIFQTMTYAPHFISTVVISGMIILFLSPDMGIINILLKGMGFQSVFFMQEKGLFKWIYVLSGIWQGAGWQASIYYAALSGVDKETVEAARIDGTNRFQIVRYINFPVMIPTMTMLFILSCGSLFSVGYEKVFLLQNSTNLPGSEVISTYVYKVGLINQDFGFSTATGLFNSVINLVILIAANQLMRRISEDTIW